MKPEKTPTSEPDPFSTGTSPFEVLVEFNKSLKTLEDLQKMLEIVDKYSKIDDVYRRADDIYRRAK